jgi:SAM-dependent methyltransferase
VLELGPGSCRDSRFFLENGAELVTGVDASPVVRPYASALAHDFSGRFVFHPVLFGDFDFGEKYDLIFALYSLQYHGIEGFEELVERVLGSLAPGGVFAATFIGADHFMKRIWTDVAFSSKQDIDRRLESLRIENIHEQRDMEYDVGFEGLVNHFVVTARKP